MHFDADNLPIRRPSMVAAGHWRDITINDSLDEAVATNGDGLALAATQFDSGDVRSFTYNELNAMVNRVAVGLYRLGIRP
ncbi:MAG: cyclohexanecarboxylate-CoA ligase, partial [Actinomycetota bacterium]|nr:cyclohexanecarboxylate-CoA ligase [Actinomycetota bacterium]